MGGGARLKTILNLMVVMGGGRGDTEGRGKAVGSRSYITQKELLFFTILIYKFSIFLKFATWPYTYTSVEVVILLSSILLFKEVKFALIVSLKRT